MAAIGKEAFALQALIHLFLFSLANLGINMAIKTFGKMKMYSPTRGRDKVVIWNSPGEIWP
jgi:hypothetical protein